MEAPENFSPSFDKDIHIKTIDPTPDHVTIIESVRNTISSSDHYDEMWCTDNEIMRFLIARNFKHNETCALLEEALEWRNTRKAHLLETKEDWQSFLHREHSTGKLVVQGSDQWGRPVITFNNTVENTTNVDDQMTFLAWILGFAIREMPSHVDKYVTFLHLNDFSMFNTPPMQSTRETIKMLCSCFPERLGHAIIYQPPFLFEAFWNAVQVFIDPKTVSKVIFIRGDVSPGSPNDITMNTIIGSNWRELTGATQPVHAPGCSPGYRHDEFWPQLMDRVKMVQEKESQGSAGSGVDGKTTPTAADGGEEEVVSVDEIA